MQQSLSVAVKCWEFIEKLKESEDIAKWKKKATLDQGIVCKSPEPTPDLVIKMMKDMAVPMKFYSVHEVGAGFVDSDIAQKYFSEFGYKNFKNLFCNENVVSRTATN